MARRTHPTAARGIPEESRNLVVDLLGRSDPNLWFHFDTAKEDELQFLQQNLKIHDPTMEDIVHQNQRPKLDSVDDYVYLAVHPAQITMHQR